MLSQLREHFVWRMCRQLIWQPECKQNWHCVFGNKFMFKMSPPKNNFVMLMHLFQWWIMGPSAQRIQRNYICRSQDIVVRMQIKQGILINTESPTPLPLLSEALTIALFQKHGIWINILLCWNRTQACLTRKIHHNFVLMSMAFAVLIMGELLAVYNAHRETLCQCKDNLECKDYTKNTHLCINIKKY